MLCPNADKLPLQWIWKFSATILVHQSHPCCQFKILWNLGLFLEVSIWLNADTHFNYISTWQDRLLSFNKYGQHRYQYKTVCTLVCWKWFATSSFLTKKGIAINQNCTFSRFAKPPRLFYIQLWHFHCQVCLGKAQSKHIKSISWVENGCRVEVSFEAPQVF